MSLLTMKDLAEKLNTSRYTIYRLKGSRQFPKAQYVGPRSPRWDEREIDYWLTAHAPFNRKAV